MRLFRKQPPLDPVPPIAAENQRMRSTIESMCKEIEEHVQRRRGNRTDEIPTQEHAHPSA